MDQSQRPSPAPWIFGGIGLGAALAWLWISLCRLPVSNWNDLRLAAVLMATHGEPVYSLPGTGVLSTWLYGPVPLWLWSPAALATSALSTMLAGGVINVVYCVGALAATAWLWPTRHLPGATRAAALALSILLWPEAAFRFLQVDNLIVACALVGNLALLRGGNGPCWRWVAALTTAAAMGSKPTAMGILLGQGVWLWRTENARAAGKFVAQTILCGAILAAIAGVQFGFRELWFGVVTVPAHLPWVEEPFARLREMAPALAVQLLLPALLWGGGVLRANHNRALQLPLLCWLCTVPFGLAGLCTTGGSINHLHGFQILLTPLLLALFARWPIGRGWVPAAAAVMLLLGRIAVSDHAPLRPASARLDAAAQLVASAPQQVWLPWAPLVTYFSEQRFDHTEDGIYVRFITGHPVSIAHARDRLPPRFSMMVLPRGNGDWGLARKLAPHSATEREFGPWRIVEWTPDPAAR